MRARIIETERGRWQLVGGSDSLADERSAREFDALLNIARSSRERAYAPYSKFLVGSAVRMGGVTFSGANVENASYGATMCAERSAIYKGISEGHRQIDLIAVSTGAAAGAPIDSRSPCGMCRQVIAEFAVPGALVLLDAGRTRDHEFNGEVVLFDDLLPWKFRLSE